MIKFNSIAFMVIIAFAILGFIVFGITIHEFSHFQDYNEVARKGNICIFNIPTNGSEILKYDATAGQFAFKYHPDNAERVEEITKYTEKKAYAISIIITLFFFICYFSVIKQRRKYLAKDI